MRITIEIDTDGDAFREFAGDELQQVFSQCQRTLDSWESYGTCLDYEAVLFDSNGNRCGFIRSRDE